MTDTEADTRAKLIDPALARSGWLPERIRREHQFTDGPITVVGRSYRRGTIKRCDYALRWTRDHVIAVVEAKAQDVPATDGLQQAIAYAITLGASFAYATNGLTIIERDLLTGVEATLEDFPSPQALHERWRIGNGVAPESGRVLAVPLYAGKHKPRYYQLIAVNLAVEAISAGRERALLTLATGTGKSFIALQICWREAFWEVLDGKDLPFEELIVSTPRLQDARPIPLPPAAEQLAAVGMLTVHHAQLAKVEATAVAMTRDQERLERTILGKAFRGDLVDPAGPT